MHKCESGDTNKTNAKGEYTCRVWDDVTFYIGNFPIGKAIVQKKITTPYTLFPNDIDTAINLARLLQTLDYLFEISSSDIINQVDIIEAANLKRDDNFGSAVSIDGNYIIIGADSYKNRGSAYLFKIDTVNKKANQIAKLEAPTSTRDDDFGFSVSIDTEYIVIGDKTGAAYLFTLDSNTDMVNKGEIFKPIDSKDNSFGTSVSISGDYIVVGADQNSTVGGKGLAYIYKINSSSSLSLLKTLEGDFAQSYFGSSVSIDSQYILIGAYGEDIGLIKENAGYAYLFQKESDTSIKLIKKNNGS